ncbi:hypothetical protein [uncultured Bacteroides sp.]|nr:hypothetical protein [uncultured Bacteroides sp.]
MKHVCIFIWFALMFPICIVAQDKPLDLQIQYNKETKNLVFTVTNKAKAEIYFMNDRGNKQDSLFWLKAYDANNECTFWLDFVYCHAGEKIRKVFVMQPGETIIFSYPSLLERYIEANHPSTKKIEIDACLVYGTTDPVKLIYDRATVSFDYWFAHLLKERTDKMFHFKA